MTTDARERVLDLMGRAMGRFAMLRPGDRVAVGVSGGKDSLCLLDALLAYRARAPFAYEVVAVTIEQGKFKSDVGALRTQIAALGIEWIVRDEPATLADPLVGGMYPVRIRIVVVFPAPLGPRKPRISPLGTSNEMSSTAVMRPYCFVRCSTLITAWYLPREVLKLGPLWPAAS